MTPIAQPPTSARQAHRRDEELRDVVLFRAGDDEQPREQLFNLYNLAANAVSYGIAVNSARTGLGTAPPVGVALATESLY